MLWLTTAIQPWFAWMIPYQPQNLERRDLVANRISVDEAVEILLYWLDLVLINVGLQMSEGLSV